MNSGAKNLILCMMKIYMHTCPSLLYSIKASASAWPSNLVPSSRLSLRKEYTSLEPYWLIRSFLSSSISSSITSVNRRLSRIIGFYTRRIHTFFKLQNVCQFHIANMIPFVYIKTLNQMKLKCINVAPTGIRIEKVKLFNLIIKFKTN